MPVNLAAPLSADLHAVPGVRIGTAMAGVRKANRRDLVLFVLDEGAVVADGPLDALRQAAGGLGLEDLFLRLVARPDPA